MDSWKNVKDDSESFHKKQRAQARILFLLVPVITITFLFATSIFLKYGENYNIFSNKLNNISSFIIQKTTSTAFERIEYLDGLCKYGNMEFYDKR